MPTHKSSAPFLSELKPSKLLQRLIILIHTLALFACLANALPWVAKLGLVMLVGLNFRRQRLQLKKEPHTIKYTEKRGWEIASGQDFKAVQVLLSTVVTTRFIFLHLKDQPTILIAQDALSEADYSQLAVKLKMTAHQPPQRH